MAKDVKVLVRELWSGKAPGATGSGSEDRPRLTPFLVTAPKPSACVIVCPGGGYGGRAPHEGEPNARWLNSAGVSAFVLDYRVSPYRHPIPLGDAQRAIRTVRHMAKAYNIDPNRIGILGFSAGGHLAVSAATLFDSGNPKAKDPIDRQSSRPDALIACYPVVTFGEWRHDGSMQNLLGSGNPSEEMRRALSLETRVTPQTPPTFIWATADDGAVPVENSLMLASALSRARVPFQIQVFPHGNHGLGLAAEDPTVRQWTDLCARWLIDIGFRTGAAI
jgi:acetyl esterase/lipase